MSMKHSLVLCTLLAACTSIVACTDEEVPADGDPLVDAGSLVRVTTSSKVGVLLEDFPAASRDRIADQLLGESPTFWTERAKWQLRLTAVRLVYRKYYFDESEWDLKNALTLPPESQWNIVLDPAGPTRTTVDGHDVVAIDYELISTLLSDFESPGISEPALDAIGGVWDEAFVFPVDPTLLLQRTGYACMTEDQFPPGSVDAEDAFRFYDDTCEVELPGEQFCHYAEPLPTESCVEAVVNAIGSVATDLHYERLPWDPVLADQVRVAPPTVADSPDLEVLTDGEGLNDNRVLYKYFEEDSCELVEQCIGGSGWRRLLVFDSHDHNVGGQPLHIGEVDYYVEGLGGDLIDNNVYTLSECHNHYHFQYYGSFHFGTGVNQTTTQKMGFCLESTDRLSNHEQSPLHTEYGCEYQGVSAGWGDLYGSSLPCNWVDITDVDTSAGSVTDFLEFHSNPDGFLCEGQLETDASGEQVWESTSFVTEEGDPVSRPACEEAPGTEENDIGRVAVTIPQTGGYITAPCRSLHDLGPKRNCDFTVQPATPTCTAGAAVSLTCSGATALKPQVVRICETSQLLDTSLDCTFQDALANVVVEGTAATVSFTCPAARDGAEPGGEYAVYTAPVWAADGAVPIVCTP